MLTTHAIGRTQTLKVIDYATKKPISEVLIYTIDKSNKVITDSLGQADITPFSDKTLLVISHAAYAEVLFKKSDLYTSRYMLELHPKILNLDEFILSANKRFQAREEVPNQLTSISAKDIKLLDPQTSADAISSTGKVFVQKSQMGGGSPMIRGFAANKVLIVVDGIRMNNAIFRGGNLQNVISIDPNMLEKTEVVFGPGSVIYGSDALGGVIDFQTISTKFSDTGTAVTGNVFIRASSANKELTPHGDVTISTKKFSSVTSLSASRFDDLKMGVHGPEEYLRLDYADTTNGDKMAPNSTTEKQLFSGYNSISFLQKFGFKINERLKFNYSFIYSTTSDIPRYDRLIQRKNADTLKYARWDYGPQKWLVNTVTMNLNSPNKIFDNLNVTLAYQNFEESRIDRKFDSSSERTRTENVGMFSANLDFDNSISGRSTLFYGIETVYNLVNSTGMEHTGAVKTPIQTRYPDGSTYWSNAAYINFKINQSQRNTVVFGLRYNQVKLNATFDSTYYTNPDGQTINQSTAALTGSMGVAHRPNETWQINANISSGFKAPNIDDIAKVFDSEPGSVVVPNPSLKPEYLYSFDASISKKLGAKKQHHIELSGFYSFLVDAMVRRDFQVNGQDSILYDGQLSKVQALVNTGSAELAGASLIYEATITKKWTFKAAGTYTYGRDNEGLYLQHVSPLFANAHVIFSYKKVTVNAYLIYNGSMPNSRMAPTELGKPDIYLQDPNGNLYSPSWYTLNIKSAYKLNSRLLFTFGAENITNQRYRPYSSGIVAPGLNLIGSIKATF